MKFAFLVYVPRSGSTVLARHLDAVSRDVLVIPEIRLTEWLMLRSEARVCRMDAAELRGLFELDHQIGNLGLSRAELERIAQGHAGEGSRAVIEALVRRHAELRGRTPEITVIKNGVLLHRHRRLTQVFPEAPFIHIYRDGRGTVNSMIHTRSLRNARQVMGRGDVIYSARHWCRYMTEARQVTDQKRAPMCWVRYEDFLARPAEEVAAVAAFLSGHFGQRLTPGSDSTFEVPERERSIHGLVEKAPQVARSEGWKTELKPWQGIAVEHVQGELLARHGYSPHFLVGVTAGARASALGRAWLAHLWLTATHQLHRLKRAAWLSVTDFSKARAKLGNKWVRLRAEKRS